jgi:signal transduction histidine kinase
MRYSKRVYLYLSGLVAAVLSGVVVRDIYADWVVEGKPLWTTSLENSLPLALAVSVFLVGYWLYHNRERLYLASVVRWQLLSGLGTLTLALLVVGVQLIQGELKPYLIMTQIAIGGTAAGSLVGYATAQQEQTTMVAQRERDRAEALFQNASAEIVEVSATGTAVRIQRANDAFRSAFSAPSTGDSLSAIAAHDESTVTRIRDHILDGEPFEQTVTLDTTDGTRHYQLRVVPFGEDSAYVMYNDVTELQRVRTELEETVAELEASNERLEDFAYIASHDLQEPLRTVSRYAELVAEDYGDELDDVGREYLDTVVTGAERMSSMVNGLLDYSRVTTRGDEMSTVDTAAVVDEVVTDLQVLADENDGTITVESLPTVTADRDQLWQVFQNLIKNALQHAGDGPVAVTVSGTETPDGCRFTVADDGDGIDPYIEDEIFKIFKSGRNYQTESEARGIGLAVVERIVDRHDGDIRVESEEGKGSTFIFTISE